FRNFYVSDDDVNQKTVVENVILKENWSGLNGFIPALYESGGFYRAFYDVIEFYITDLDLIQYLEDEDNWEAAYPYPLVVDPLLTVRGMAQQEYYSANTDYFYKCIDDNTWVRFPQNHSFVELYGLSSSDKALLEDPLNWTGVHYSGTALSNVYQGQRHYDDSYVYEIISSGIILRTERV
ncbi:MAG: hypothetical protein GX154_02330, partial [Clostridiales bacterium]|nr:hypothetical protein [Clostridiales bacterium]